MNMFKIRRGELLDGPILSDLVMIVVHQMSLPLVKKIGSEKMRSLMEECLSNPNYRYAYMQALVAEFNGEIVGAAFGYPNDQENQIDEIFNEILYKRFGIKQGFKDTEAVGDEWYLDTVAVFDWARHRGVGTQLIEALPKIAKEHKKTCIGLNVDCKNPRAKELYTSLGFQETEQVKLGEHDYTHMRWHFSDKK